MEPDSTSDSFESEVDYKLSKWQPKVKVDRMTREEMNHYLEPSTFKISSVRSKQSNVRPLGEHSNQNSRKNVLAGSKSTVTIGSNSVITRKKVINTTPFANQRQRDADLIDPESWQWQPSVKLNPIKIIKANRSNENRISGSSGSLLEPIKFNTEDTFIEELSPLTAQRQFRQRLRAIKESSETGSSQNGNVFAGTRSNKFYLDYEKTHREVQSKERPKGTGSARKLYNPNQCIVSTPQIEKPKKKEGLMKVEKSKKRQRSVSPTDMVQTRSAKKLKK